MKKLFFTLTLMVAITSLTFASFSFTIYNNPNWLGNCTYTITAMQVSDNSSNPGCTCIWGGRGWSQVLSPATTYTFTCSCSGSPVWSTLSVTLKTQCGHTYTFGDVSSYDCRTGGNCYSCTSNYAVCWNKISTGNYEIYTDVLTGGRLMSDNPTGEAEQVMEANPDMLNRLGVNSAEEILMESNNIVSSLENIPNPVSNLMKINFELAQDADVAITLFDITGKEVLSLKKGIQAKGKNSVEVDVSSLASGMYSYSFKAGDAVLTRKFNIVR